MTRRDELIRMAKLAAQGEPISGKLCCELTAHAWAPFFERFAALVAAAERERCANACLALAMSTNADGAMALRFAAAIRALKDGGE